jgi:hypothetical protein
MKMFFTMNQIQEFIKNAEEHGACSYHLKLIKECSSLEEVLSHPRVPYWAFWYAKNVFEGRWEEMEDIIKTSPEDSYFYAKNIIKGRWLEAEETINTSPEDSYFYAKNIIKGRWLEAEETIKTSPEDYYRYEEDVIKGQWEELVVE